MKLHYNTFAACLIAVNPRIPIILAVLAVAAGAGGISESHAHSLFNSAEEFIGGYRVQIATLPEFPQVDEPSTILLRVTDIDFVEVDRFTMGLRFTYQGEQLWAIAPRAVDGSHWEVEHSFTSKGNHIVFVDLYDMNEQGEILTYTFNLSTQSPFGYIFFFSITVGASTFAVIVGYVYIPKRFPRHKPKP
ncbi:hypothetical protein CENSYa_1984 [Cenarchaeum symbiosum A]|uniref:Uncharacterized protein n=1 Tax=Cenarchaeum symbiosum (strain A) TaxID=414004 RepID=A0RZ22_CENSY|nr:hypothetical protein CENSYa_1984 [Cenarchaeum symbiosum A]